MALGGAALLLLTACSSATTGAVAGAGTVPATAPASASSSSPAANAGEPQTEWKDSICALPEFAALLKAEKLKSPSMSSLYFTGASENQPALQWCTIDLWRIGTTLLPFDTKQFKAARREAVGPESVGVGDEGFTFYAGRSGISRIGEVGVYASVPFVGAAKGYEDTLLKFLKTAVANVQNGPPPSLTAGGGICAPGLGAATDALGSAPKIQRGYSNPVVTHCLWSNETDSALATFRLSEKAIDQDEEDTQPVSGLGAQAAWLEYSDTLVVQVDDGHAAYIQIGKPDKDAAIAIYRAMEQTLKDSVS
ncbi:MAG: hypothetical protein IPL41_16540 [Micropruina sp.]|nr:hypothetical protein [Micropruina sp.]